MGRPKISISLVLFIIIYLHQLLWTMYVSVLCDCIACIAVVVVAVADDLPHVPAGLQRGGWSNGPGHSWQARASPGSRTRAASGWPGAWSSPGTAPGSCPHHTWPVDNSFVSVLFSFSPYLPGVAGQVAPHRVAVNVSPPRAGVRVALQRRTLCYHLHCCDAHRAWTHCQGTSSPGLNMCCGSCILPACKHNLNI